VILSPACVIALHPYVRDSQAVRDVSRCGRSVAWEEICASVQLLPGQQLSIEELRAFCDGKIAHYKTPRHLRITDEFPMTVTGKIRKVEMRQISIEELGLSEELTA
jgi:fatty-acyl-CoA synthase